MYDVKPLGLFCLINVFSVGLEYLRDLSGIFYILLSIFLYGVMRGTVSCTVNVYGYHKAGVQ